MEISRPNCGWGRMRRPLTTVAALLASASGVLAQGSLTPPAGPPAPNMKSLQEIWDKLCELDERVSDLEDAGTEEAAVFENGIAGIADLLGATSGYSWSVKTIDASADDVGRYASLAFDGDSNPAVAYYNATDKDLHFIEEDGSEWDKQTVHASGEVGTYCSLDFSKDGHAGIAYHRESSDSLWFAFRNDGSTAFLPYAVKSPEDSEIWGRHSSMKFAPNGRPYIVHRDQNILEMHMTYFDQSVTGTPGEFTSANWNTYNMMGVSSGYAASLAFKSDGEWGVSHGLSSSSYALHYVKSQPGGQWLSTVDPTAQSGSDSSLAYDSADKPGIAYYDQASTTLKFAVRSGSSWSVETVDANPLVGKSCSLVFTRDDRPMIAYYDEGNKDLKFAEKSTDGSWKLTTIDSVGDVGQSASLALGRFGRPSIAYYDEANGNLKFASATARVVRGQLTLGN